MIIRLGGLARGRELDAHEVNTRIKANDLNYEIEIGLKMAITVE